MDWQPSASLSALKKRAVIVQQLRDFFTDRGYWEAETPILGRYGITDVYLANIPATFRQHTYYLQTSPEYYMKRLLAAGSGPIFQLSKVFRDDELGRWHNPEFTLLEWYQLGIDHHQLLEEVDQLLQKIFHFLPVMKKTYREVFDQFCGIDPLHANLACLKAALKKFNLEYVLDEQEEDRDQYLFLLMSHVVEPALASFAMPVAVYDFPSSQAALAQVEKGVAHRFEIYYKGVELANGFHELTEEDLQRQRFLADLEVRAKKQLPSMAIDEHFLAALKAGLPPCSGVALGIDRALALALKKDKISEVLAFDFSIS